MGDVRSAKSRRFTLRFTLVLAFGGLTLLGGLFMSLITANAVGRFIRAELRNRLADSVNIAASQIAADLHRTLQSRADEGSIAYITLQNQLREFRDRGTNVRYVYTMRRRGDGQVVFVVDAEESQADVSHIGDVYTDTTPQLLAALSAPSGTTKAFVEPDFSSDQWGTWLSAFAPFYTTDGQLEGILGMDVSAESVIAHERQYRLIIWLVCALVTAFVLPIGLVFAQRIRRPLALLETEMARVKQFDLDSKVHISSRISEIDNMVNGLENMKSGLRSFRKYVPADLVKQLIALGMEARLGGVKDELTIFFSDIAGFTPISEKLPPETLVHFLGEYLDTMTAGLLHNEATVDKYLGDGIMAFWGAPKQMPDHAVRACRAALECQQRIDELNRKWQAEGQDIAFHTRIGINTGKVIVGNMGSDQRMSYSIIGDNVNFTSRLQGVNKYYGTRVLISETTYEQVKDRYITRLVDKVVVVGKTIPICIYELLGAANDVPAERCQLVEMYGKAFRLYTSRRFADAAQWFEQIMRRYGIDQPSQILLERCRTYTEKPPALDWDGSFDLQIK